MLQLNNIPARRALFVTTSSYVPRARTIGIRTLDGAEWAAFERRSLPIGLARWLARLALVATPAWLFVNEWLATPLPTTGAAKRSDQNEHVDALQRQAARASLAARSCVHKARAHWHQLCRQWNDLVTRR